MFLLLNLFARIGYDGVVVDEKLQAGVLLVSPLVHLDPGWIPTMLTFSSSVVALTPDIRIVGVGEKNLSVGHLVVDVPPGERAVEVGEGVLDPFLHFLHQLTAGVVVQPVGHLGA